MQSSRVCDVLLCPCLYCDADNSSCVYISSVFTGALWAIQGCWVLWYVWYVCVTQPAVLWYVRYVCVTQPDMLWYVWYVCVPACCVMVCMVRVSLNLLCYIPHLLRHDNISSD